MKKSKLTVDALVYDAYGTIFDVYSVSEKCEQHFPGKGAATAEIWRNKQLEYTWLRSLMGKYQNFWELTEASLIFACRSLALQLSDDVRDDLMENYLHLTPYAEVPETLQRLSKKHKQAILSNGSPHMLEQVVNNNNLRNCFQKVLSVDELTVFKTLPKSLPACNRSTGGGDRQNRLCFIQLLGCHRGKIIWL